MASSASTRRPFGWVIAGVLVGALIGHEYAQDSIPWPRRGREGLAAALKAADRMIPYVLYGCTAGALCGFAAEQFARRQRRIEAVLVLVYGVVIWLILQRFLF